MPGEILTQNGGRVQKPGGSFFYRSWKISGLVNGLLAKSLCRNPFPASEFPALAFKCFHVRMHKTCIVESEFFVWLDFPQGDDVQSVELRIWDA